MEYTVEAYNDVKLFVSETYNSLDAAKERYEEIKEEFRGIANTELFDEFGQIYEFDEINIG